MLHLTMWDVRGIADYASKFDVLNRAVPLAMLQLHIHITVKYILKMSQIAKQSLAVH